VLAILALPVIAAAIGLVTKSSSIDLFRKLVDIELNYLVALLMALQSSSGVAEEVQDKTITYLYTHPIPRWSLPAGKYIGSLLLNLALLLPAAALCYLLCLVGDKDLALELSHLWSALAALAVAAIYYGALATAFGAMVTSVPCAAMAGYVLVVDITFGLIPGAARLLAMPTHLKAIAGSYRADTGFFSGPALSPAISAPVVLSVAVLWLIIGISYATSTEYRTDK
jgi:ABC-type transport system involved in multi-copper enzyme maturation permease subunit